MSLQVYVAFVLFVIVMTGTPGAGNLTMMGIGQAAGFMAAVPFLCGLVAGAFSLNLLVGLGLGGLIEHSPNLSMLLKVFGMSYILYLGWRLLAMRPGTGRAGCGFSFWEGLVLHPTNPKTWAMSVVGFTQLSAAPMGTVARLAVFILTFMFFQVVFHSTWGLAGTAILRTLRSPRILTGVNCVLVAAMVGATAYALFI